MVFVVALSGVLSPPVCAWSDMGPALFSWGWWRGHRIVRSAICRVALAGRWVRAVGAQQRCRSNLGPEVPRVAFNGGNPPEMRLDSGG